MEFVRIITETKIPISKSSDRRIDVFEHRYGIKLKQTTADATVLKLLHKHFPAQSFSELRNKVQAHDYIFLSDMEKYDGERRMAKLLREFDKAGVETELFEESRYTPASWQTEPMSQEYFKSVLQRDCEIEKEISSCFLGGSTKRCVG